MLTYCPDSTGRRNTLLNGLEHGVQCLGRRLPPERLAWSTIESGSYGSEVAHGVRAKIGSLGEVLPQQPIGVLIGPPLPE